MDPDKKCIIIQNFKNFYFDSTKEIFRTSFNWQIKNLHAEIMDMYKTKKNHLKELIDYIKNGKRRIVRHSDNSNTQNNETNIEYNILLNCLIEDYNRLIEMDKLEPINLLPCTTEKMKETQGLILCEKWYEVDATQQLVHFVLFLITILKTMDSETRSLPNLKGTVEEHVSYQDVFETFVDLLQDRVFDNSVDHNK